jgi:hypothetical protein
MLQILRRLINNTHIPVEITRNTPIKSSRRIKLLLTCSLWSIKPPDWQNGFNKTIVGDTPKWAAKQNKRMITHSSNLKVRIPTCQPKDQFVCLLIEQNVTSWRTSSPSDISTQQEGYNKYNPGAIRNLHANLINSQESCEAPEWTLEFCVESCQK